MCGIAGLIPRDSGDDPAVLRTVAEMTRRLRHRGPDGEGLWSDGQGVVALGHRRLAIVDLSPTGHQPMLSASGRYVIAFNGEIYNHRTLRRELEARGARFRGTSDTEVLLAGVEAWGLRQTLERSTGMFAIALWDREQRRLHLARDRMGEKPLYVWRSRRGLAFASELRPVLHANDFDFKVDRQVLGLYLRYGYVPDPMCIVEGAHKVAPGTIETWNLGDGPLPASPVVEHYWSLDACSIEVPTRREEAIELLHAELARAVADQRVADVPVGAFLSGGIDSTAVTAVMQSISGEPVRTFCVSFDDPAYDEGPYARRIAEHLGTRHTEIRVGTADLLAIVERLPEIYDEPFADESAIPTIAVARAARDHVTVCLSGDGGDELFGGYNRYYWPTRVFDAVGRWPQPLRQASAGVLRLGASVVPEALLRWAARGTAPTTGPIQNLRGKVAKLAATMSAANASDAYVQLVRRDGSSPVTGHAGSLEDPYDRRLRDLLANEGLLAGATRWDLETYLPGDNLVKVDRASMAVALEMRAPLLDHRVVELSRAMLCSFGSPLYAIEPKWPLRSMLGRYVPRSFLDRPKMGFSVPLDRWLKNELRDWSNSNKPQYYAEVTDSLPNRGANALPLNDQWARMVFTQWKQRITTRTHKMGDTGDA